MSQDELAEKIGVSRQSVSLWETDQTQPTIDNIIMLTKIFNISADMLLADASGAENNTPKKAPNTHPKKNLRIVLFAVLSAAIVVIAAGAVVLLVHADNRSDGTGTSGEAADTSGVQSSAGVPNAGEADADSTKTEFDLFSYCRDFAIEKGSLNGDYCIYQQEATKYGGYDNEYFSISYWSDSNMVEFCLHCPLDETLSENFYLRMRGGYDRKYEYVSSKYYRDTGESLRSASGYIDPTVFYDGYPIPCDSYQGSADGQTEFMEESRVGMCDLIRCLKQFVEEENMECDFSDFDFAKF